jgi:hypothetical protein
LLLLPHGPQAVPQLVKVAEEVRQAFPEVLSPNVILKAGDAPGPDTGVPAWVDTEGRAYERLGVSDRALILVRPDGYIGYRCQPADGQALAKYLGRYLAGRLDANR